MVKIYVQVKVFDRIKEIKGIEEFDNTDAVILVTCIIKNEGKFYGQLS